MFKFLIAVVVIFYSNASASVSPLFSSDNEKELVFFFSLHCESCYLANGSVSTFNLSVAKNNNINVKKVPIIQEGWEFGARLHFLLLASRDKYPLTQYEREIAGFSIVANTPKEDWPEKDYEYAQLLRDNGMVFDPLEFKGWWNFAEVMMLSSEDVMEDAGLSNITVPSARYYSGGKEYWVRLNSEDADPEVSFLRKIISVVD